MKLEKATRTLLIVLALFGLLLTVQAHPANIPVARAKVQPDGHFELSITFDVLAFVLDQTPQIVLDAPMNNLLDGSSADLQTRLDAAKTRFLQGLRIGSTGHLGVVDSLSFPSSVDIQRFVSGNPQPRLPVMMTATLKGHIGLSPRKISFQFPEVMGTLVLTTEFPYTEPISESIESGDESNTLDVPTQAQIDSVAASMKAFRKPVVTVSDQPEASARKAIQIQYNRWSKAYMKHDLAILFSILTPDYKIRTAKGLVISRKEYDLMLQVRKKKHSDTTVYRTEILRITLKHGVAAVWSRETTTDPGLNQNTGKSQAVTYQHDYIDLWVYAKNQWLLKNTATQKELLLPPK